MAELYKTITEQSIDRHFPNDPSAKASIMSQIQSENDTFDPHRIETTDNPQKGIGLFQFTGAQRDSLERWLRDNGKANTIDNQIEYFKIVTTTTNQDWADKYHDIGAGHRNHIRNAFASGSAADISKELSNRFEKFKGYKTDVSRPNLATKLESTYQQEYVNRLANQRQIQPTPQQAGHMGFAMEGFGTPPPLKLGEPTGEYTPEGRPLFLNNQGGKSSEYSVGVKDPRINNKALTHIPSIYDGSILNQKDAIQEVVDAGGYDRLTGRYIEEGGDPNARSMSLRNIPHHIGGATTDTSRYRQQRLPSLQEAAQTAQVQPALNPFPWLNEVSGSYSHPIDKSAMYPQKKMFKSRSMYPQPKNF